MSDFTELVDLAAARLGGVALAADDEFFAGKDNLLKPERPIFIEEKYTDRGKWMDGWETRRRRTPGHDWCIVRLGIPGVIRGLVVDTSFFTGNFPSHCSLDACVAAPGDDGGALAGHTGWIEILPASGLVGDTANPFEIADRRRFTHVRLNIYPDGGVARLRVHGEPVPDWRALLAAGDIVNVSGIERGGRPIDCSDRFYSHPRNLLMPYRAANMGDGWETKRRRGPGHDWCVIRLGIQSVVRRVEIDTAHFKGNYPDGCSVDVARPAGEITPATEWEEVLPRVKLGPDAAHAFDLRLGAPATHVRLNMYPDGGISRFRVFGTPTREGLLAEGLRALNARDAGAILAALTDCCGSSRWAEAMLARFPFPSVDDLLAHAGRVWNALDRDDWLEAFGHHPRIGDGSRAAAQSDAAHVWSGQEQSAARGGSADVLAALERETRAYEQRFGHVFLVRAAGRSSEEMLAMLRQRMNNDPDVELRVAAGEQEAITALRLEKLLLGA